jgi:hypothetical protein
MALNMSEIAADIEDMTGVGQNLTKHVLRALAEIAAEEIEAGEDFTVPGIVSIKYAYKPPQKKGERWRKGQERTKFGGETEIAESDSPPVKASIRLKAAPTGAVYKLRPGTKPEAQAAFLKSKTGKAVISRKSK